MAATLAPNRHVITQSEQFFGGLQLHISMDNKHKNNWSCPSCGCNNMGRAKLCGLCGILNPKYTVKPKDAHNKYMITKERTKLSNPKDIFKRLKHNFPQYKKYKTVTHSKKRRKSLKQPQHAPMHSLLTKLNLTNSISNPTSTLFKNFNSDTKHDTISFIDSVFGTINFSNNPFGAETEVPSIISDEDISDLPSPLSDPDSEQLHFMDLSIANIPKPTLHNRQMSVSAPSTPPSRIKKPKDSIRVNTNIRPLLFGVIHCPAPSKKNRLNIVLKNVELIIKHSFDGCWFINHGYSANHLVSVILEVHKKYPKLWLGANLLGIAEKKIFKFVKTHKLYRVLKGVWCENSGIRLSTEELDHIFVKQFDRTNSVQRSINTQSLNVWPWDEHKDSDASVPMFGEYKSNNSAVSSTSAKSDKKRVTFSTVSDTLMNENEILPESEEKHLEMKTEPIAKVKKKNDCFARARLNRIKKYKFEGLYFGGVDLKANACIKIPSQKQIRTRRRTYSAADGDTPVTPQTPKAGNVNIIKGFRKGRAKSQHSGSPRLNKYRKSKQKRKGSRGVVLEKSLSSRIVTDNSETVLATISSDDSRTPKAKKRGKKGSVPMPPQIKTQSVNRYKYHITPKRRAKHRSKNGKYQIKKKNGLKNGHKSKGKNKKVYSMTDSEINDEELDIAIDASFWNGNLSVAKSLELADVKPKSPMSDSMESPPPLPSTPNGVLSSTNIKLHNLALHRPISTDSVGINGRESMDKMEIVEDNESVSIENNAHSSIFETKSKRKGRYSPSQLSHSQSMPHGHNVQFSHESRSSTQSQRSEDAFSVYSHTSQMSDTWSEYGSVNESLDDYYEALNTLGKYACRGYMDVITTSGKGKNIGIKVKALAEACHKKCLLAVASGIRIENIDVFLPYVDILMVSTCISRDFHCFDPRKMAKFKRSIDQYFDSNKK